MLTLCNTIYLIRRRIYYTMRLLPPRGLSHTLPVNPSVQTKREEGVTQKCFLWKRVLEVSIGSTDARDLLGRYVIGCDARLPIRRDRDQLRVSVRVP